MVKMLADSDMIKGTSSVSGLYSSKREDINYVNKPVYRVLIYQSEKRGHDKLCKKGGGALQVIL
jgi:hypothetical protein